VSFTKIEIDLHLRAPQLGRVHARSGRLVILLGWGAAFSILVKFSAAATLLSIRSDFLDTGKQEESQRMPQDEIYLRPWVERIHSLPELPQL